MALAAASVFEVHTGGNDTNGGGFVTGASGTDYSLVDAKRTATGSNDSTTDAVAVGTGVITSVSSAFTSAIVGNIIYLAGGTGTLTGGWYQVTVFTSATSITVDRNVAAGTGITMNIGGALASPGQAGGVGLVDGNSIYIKAGTYTIASATINIATGCLSIGVRAYVEGYQTTRGDFGTAPLLQASGIATTSLIAGTVSNNTFVNLVVDGAGLTAIRGFSTTRAIIYRCGALNCTNSGFVTTGFVSRSYATGCSTQVAFVGTGGGSFGTCVAYTNTVTGFAVAFATIDHCISYGNTGASSDGFLLSGTAQCLSSVAYANGRDGFRVDSSTGIFRNNIAEANSAFGFRNLSVFNCIMINNATFNNTSGATSGTFIILVNSVVGTGSFFTNAAGADFSLNNTAGAGAAARAVGYPGVLPIGGTGFLDIGTLQHADPASSGGMNIFAGEGIGSVITG